MVAPLASVHKFLRLCGLCKELAFGPQYVGDTVAFFVQFIPIQQVMPPVPGKNSLHVLDQDFLPAAAVKSVVLLSA